MRYLQFLYALHTLVADGRYQVAGAQQVHHLACHLYEVTVHYVLYDKVALVVMETTYLELCSGEELVYTLAEKKDGSTLQLALWCEEVEIAQHIFR